MVGLLALVFFEGNTKRSLNSFNFNRAFSSLVIIAVIGILLTATVGFTSKHPNLGSSIVEISNYHR